MDHTFRRAHFSAAIGLRTGADLDAARTADSAPLRGPAAVEAFPDG